MSLTDTQYKQIVDFLDANMSVKEMDQFQKDLSSSDELRQQFNFEKAVREDFQSPKKTAAEISEQPVKPVVPVINMNAGRKWWAASIAAGLLLAIAGKFFFFNGVPIDNNVVVNRTPDIPVKKDTVQKFPVQVTDSTITKPAMALLYKKYFTKDPPPQDPPMILADAMVQYNNGDYNGIQHFNTADIPVTRGNDSINSKENILQLAHYYKGLSFLQTNNLSKAIDNFKWILGNSHDKQLLEKANWYLALAYMKKDTAAAALPILTKLQKDKAAFSKQAAALLQAMNK